MVLIFLWLWDGTDLNTDLAGNKPAKMPSPPPPSYSLCARASHVLCQHSGRGWKASQQQYRVVSEINRREIMVLLFPLKPANCSKPTCSKIWSIRTISADDEIRSTLLCGWDWESSLPFVSYSHVPPACNLFIPKMEEFSLKQLFPLSYSDFFFFFFFFYTATVFLV